VIKKTNSRYKEETAVSSENSYM